MHEDFFPTMEVSTWMTDAGPLDVLRNIPTANGDRVDFESLVRRAKLCLAVALCCRRS